VAEANTGEHGRREKLAFGEEELVVLLPVSHRRSISLTIPSYFSLMRCGLVVYVWIELQRAEKLTNQAA
jgi:hypothetical protein